MITKSELIEYLKHTPENTNYNILYSSLYNGSNKEAVDEFIEVLSRGNLSLAALQPYLAKLYEDDKTISPEPLPPFSSGGGSVPKPLTYDYMPEGYPKKTLGTATLMEEQEVAFALEGGAAPGEGAAYGELPALEIVEGKTYEVNWDGAAYECVCDALGPSLSFGNIYILSDNDADDTGEPFAYYCDYTVGDSYFATLDTAASHTISVKKTVETVTPMAEEFLPNIPADKLPAGGGVQPDWNQNDETQPDYVKNRPFYIGNPVETVLVEESTVTFEDLGGVYGADFPSTFEATVGETYKVSWDGTVYECTCVDYDGPAIGNLSIENDYPDTGEPFLIMIYKGEGINIVTADTSASHTFSISRILVEIVKIPTKYLPVASEIEPGIMSVDYLLQQVRDKYFSGTDSQVTGYGWADVIEEYANYNNSYNIHSPGEFGGAVLSCYDDVINQNIEFVLSGSKSIECWKLSQSATSSEQLWGIYKDGVVISSSTTDSTKKFKITVDDSGTLSTTMASDPTSSMQIATKKYVDEHAGGVTTLHINVTAVNRETMEATFTADKTPLEMQQASINGPIWCVITIAAGLMAQEAVSIGVPPAWGGGQPAFGYLTNLTHNDNGNNTVSYVVRRGTNDSWILDVTQFGG